MPTGRFGLAAEVLNGILYAIGGSTGGDRLGTVEAYDPATDTWTSQAPLPTARKDFAAGVVDGILYAVGGVDVNYLALGNGDRKSTRLNSSHQIISYAVFCSIKKMIYVIVFL